MKGKLYPNTRHELFMETDASRQAFLKDIDNHFMSASSVY
jgi:alpha-beta hydrolase superfamily lysophospholipase